LSAHNLVLNKIILRFLNGLGAYQSTYFTYVIDVPSNNNIGKFKFNIDELNYK